MDTSKPLRPAKHLVWRVVEGEAIILDANDERKVYELDESGTFLWEIITNRPTNVDGLIDAFLLEYDCEKEEGQDVVVTFCRNLLTEKMLEI